MGLKLRDCLKNFLVVACLVYPQLSFGWGEDGHKLIALVGSKLTFKGNQFWTANSQNMVNLTTVPDLYWKQGNLHLIETQTHFYQPDSFFPNPSQFNQLPHDFNAATAKFGMQNVIADGTAPWRINQFYNLALQALKNHDFTTAVEMAGAMSHYIGDMSQPLHVTENFDGQKTGDAGIHHFFETVNIQANLQSLPQPVTASAQALMKNPKFQQQFNGTVVDNVFNEVFRAYALKDQVIQTDVKMGRTGAGAQQQLAIAKDRLADGAATLAVLLTRLWQQSGLQDSGATANIQVPPWVKPDYYNAPNPVSLSSSQINEAISYETAHLVLGDDCN